MTQVRRSPGRLSPGSRQHFQAQSGIRDSRRRAHLARVMCVFLDPRQSWTQLIVVETPRCDRGAIFAMGAIELALDQPPCAIRVRRATGWRSLKMLAGARSAEIFRLPTGRPWRGQDKEAMVMDTRIRRLASLLVAITLAPVWAAGPAGEGGAVRFNGIAASILKPVVEAVAATGPVLAGEKIATRDGAPGPKTLANGLYMSGRFTYAFFSGSVTVTLDRINNDSLAMTGPLRLDLWATTTRPARAAAFSGYRIASFSTFPSLLPRTHYSDITRSAVIVEPPAGTYWLVLALNEWDATTCLAADYYCLEDSFVSDDLTTFGTPPPGGIVTLAGATSALCMEGVPAEVAAELQRRAPGMYITYPPSTTCSSLGLAFFAGYLSESNITIRVYTDNAANAATLCATNLLVGCTAGTTSGPFTDLWWNANEPGWGVSISHHASGVAFVAWYTYDAAGKPKWYVVSNCVVSGMGCAGTLHEMTGPPFGPAFDPSQVVARNVGSLAFTFTDLNAGTMRYDVNGQVGTKAISRQPF